MKMFVPDITEIWDEILSEKMIKKHRQYGNSIYDTDAIFSDIGDPEYLIKVRLDDKMRRLKTLDQASSKYDSELMEIIAYIMHLLNWRRNSGKYEEKESDVKRFEFPSGNRQSGNTEQSTKDSREDLKRKLRIAGVW